MPISWHILFSYAVRQHGIQSVEYNHTCTNRNSFKQYTVFPQQTLDFLPQQTLKSKINLLLHNIWKWNLCCTIILAVILVRFQLEWPHILPFTFGIQIPHILHKWLPTNTIPIMIQIVYFTNWVIHTLHHIHCPHSYSQTRTIILRKPGQIMADLMGSIAANWVYFWGWVIPTLHHSHCRFGKKDWKRTNTLDLTYFYFYLFFLI